ncbi:hypothetical protein BS78_10G217400 [Paspalum vaginatum]|nr:hypothetical protein BS78_10G217400 [Paspalum vaginatum]
MAMARQQSVAVQSQDVGAEGHPRAATIAGVVVKPHEADAQDHQPAATMDQQLVGATMAPADGSSFIPNVDANFKPTVGMTFNTIVDAERFYKNYAHNAGFSVRIGQQKKEGEEILTKRFYCSREDKRHLLRSNRYVNERAKSTLFNCHKASIGTSQA